METVKTNLGKVSITVEKDYHSSEKEYNKLTVVEEQGTFKTYLSRKPVPIGVELTNREYWICFSGVLESITFDYLKFKRDYASGEALEDNSIITRHILDRNIERIKIALKAISEEEIDDDAVIERTIKNRNITSNKIAQENILTEHFAEKSVITAILADYAVTSIKLANGSVTSEKISSTLMNLIKAGTGISEELIEEMESYNERLNVLESADMTIIVSFTGDTTSIEFTDSTTIINKSVTYNIEVSKADADVSWSIIEAGIEGTDKSGNTNVTFNDVGSHTFTFKVIVNYHGVIRTVLKSITFNVCKKSYIGYSAIENYNDIIQGETIAEGLNSIVSPNGVNGIRNIINENIPAYLWICIPKNGNADLVHNIQQLGILTVNIPYNIYQNDSYTFYRTITKHNIGEYTFKIE